MTKRTVLRLLTVGGLVVLALPGTAQQASKFEPFDFPTGDALGVYTMLDLKKVDKHHVETLVRQRMIRSGNLSFTRRLIDCRGSMRYKTLGSAFDDIEGLKRSKPDTKWNTLVPGSSAHGTALAACERL